MIGMRWSKQHREPYPCTPIPSAVSRYAYRFQPSHFVTWPRPTLGVRCGRTTDAARNTHERRPWRVLASGDNVDGQYPYSRAVGSRHAWYKSIT